MSTRCQIGIYKTKPAKLSNPEVLLYRHSDGYPDGVLPELKKFLTFWKSNRGISDSEYTGARLLQFLTNEYDKGTLELDKQYPSMKNIVDKSDGLTGTLGYGICRNFHWDIEYYYAIYPSVIEVYEVVDAEKEKFHLLETIEL